MIKRLTHINPIKFGTVFAVLQALLSLVLFVPFFLIFAAIGSSLPQSPNSPPIPAAFLGGGMLVMALILPIFYGIVGFIIGIIAAFIYNLVAGWTGGLEFTVTDVPPAIPGQGTLPANY